MRVETETIKISRVYLLDSELQKLEEWEELHIKREKFSLFFI